MKQRHNNSELVSLTVFRLNACTGVMEREMLWVTGENNNKQYQTFVMGNGRDRMWWVMGETTIIGLSLFPTAVGSMCCCIFGSFSLNEFLRGLFTIWARCHSLFNKYCSLSENGVSHCLMQLIIPSFTGNIFTFICKYLVIHIYWVHVVVLLLTMVTMIHTSTLLSTCVCYLQLNLVNCDLVRLSTSRRPIDPFALLITQQFGIATHEGKTDILLTTDDVSSRPDIQQSISRSCLLLRWGVTMDIVMSMLDRTSSTVMRNPSG